MSLENFRVIELSDKFIHVEKLALFFVASALSLTSYYVLNRTANVF